MLGAIYWKPQFEWIVDRIFVLNDIRYHQFITRELKTKGPTNLEAKDRTLMSTLTLMDVDYVFEARIVCNPAESLNTSNGHGTPGDRAFSYRQEALRRMNKGNQFRQPFFGKSGMTAHWELVTPADKVTPKPINQDIGEMLYDLRPVDIRRDKFEPIFFEAKLVNGVLEVPWYLHRTLLPHKFEARARYHEAA